MNRNQSTSEFHNPIRLLAVACALTITVVTWLGWNIYDTYRIAKLKEQRSGRIVVLRGRILHLDEVLTMSVRMAAATGNLQWEERYRTFEPQLTAAITEVLVIEKKYGQDTTPRAMLTDEANAKLIKMENRGFLLVHAGQLKEAQALLFSDEYERQKKVYAQGMADLDNHLRQINIVESRSRDQDIVSLMTAVAVALLVTAGGWIVILGALRKWQQRLVQSNHDLTRIFHRFILPTSYWC